VSFGDFFKSFYNLWILIREIQLFNASIHIIGPEISISNICRHRYLIFLVNEFVSEFNWKTEIKIKYASLTHIFELCTSLTNFCLFVSRVRTWFPSENCERSCTNFTVSVEFRLGHPDVRILPKTSFTKNWEVRLFPTLFIYSGSDSETPFSSTLHFNIWLKIIILINFQI
jgi:hypothetical protein